MDWPKLFLQWLSTWKKLQFFSQLKGRQHWTICSSLLNCVLAKLHCCAQIQPRHTLKNISLHVQLCCAHMRLFAAHWCVAICNVHAQIYCTLNPPRILLSACIAICVSVPAPYIPWIGFLWLRMHCHWDFNAGHWLQQQTRGGTSSTLHPQDTPFICLLCFILVPSIFCSSPNQIHPPPFLLTAQQHILCSFQARHIAQLMTNNLHIRICFTCLLDFSPFPKPAPQPSHHLGPERRRR